MNRIPDKFPIIVAASLAKISVLDHDVIDLSVVSQQVNDIRKKTLEVNALQYCRKKKTEIKQQLGGFKKRWMKCHRLFPHFSEMKLSIPSFTSTAVYSEVAKP